MKWIELDVYLTFPSEDVEKTRYVISVDEITVISQQVDNYIIIALKNTETIYADRFLWSGIKIALKGKENYYEIHND